MYLGASGDLRAETQALESLYSQSIRLSAARDETCADILLPSHPDNYQEILPVMSSTKVQLMANAKELLKIYSLITNELNSVDLKHPSTKKTHTIKPFLKMVSEIGGENYLMALSMNSLFISIDTKGKLYDKQKRENYNC